MPRKPKKLPDYFTPEEASVHADLVESLANLKSFHRRDRHRPLFDISRQWVSKSMKEAAAPQG